jgi:hypothetical protein
MPTKLEKLLGKYEQKLLPVISISLLTERKTGLRMTNTAMERQRQTLDSPE